MKPRIGVSSCLLGNEVRYDGGHKYHRYVSRTLAHYFSLEVFCPEAGAGLGIPRPPIHLVKTAHGVRSLHVRDHEIDVTDKIRHYASQSRGKLAKLSGFILKKDSPSCGMERVRLYDDSRPESHPQREGQGIFVSHLQNRFPLLPLEEEGRLNDPVLRENFIERVYAYHRWLQLCETDMRPADLVTFHAAHKYTLMAHDQQQAVELGRRVAACGKGDFEAHCDEYIRGFMAVLKQKVTRQRHANVLFHLFGYFSKHIEMPERQHLLHIIESYQQGMYPLIVPITLLRHYFRKYPHPYIEQQVYLNPHPDELMLRNQL